MENTLNNIRNSIDKLKELNGENFNLGIDIICRALQKLKSILPVVEESKKVLKTEAQEMNDKIKRFDVLNKILTTSDKWPEAATSDLIINLSDEKALIENAGLILDELIPIKLSGKRFVEYYSRDGGWVQRMAAERGAISSLNSSNDIPKDIDVAYTFDCIEYQSNIKANLAKVYANLKPDGRYYFRCHNYFSRYSTRLYRKYNKAYLNLIFKPDELMSIYPDVNSHIQKHYGLDEGIYGEKGYDDLLTELGFKIIQKVPTYDALESLFMMDGVLERIKDNNPVLRECGKKEMVDILEIQFIDYILGK